MRVSLAGDGGRKVASPDPKGSSTDPSPPLPASDFLGGQLRRMSPRFFAADLLPDPGRWADGLADLGRVAVNESDRVVVFVRLGADLTRVPAAETESW